MKLQVLGWLVWILAMLSIYIQGLIGIFLWSTLMLLSITLWVWGNKLE
ncbi:hypothetical protein LCGC14_0652210 [marine sediment metagenome]|uniref:Uncharacterized protein n=1 Tax=marine sediment metagenome TaxID=412755 RepID=A0A0F9U4G2_9ZZZZ